MYEEKSSIDWKGLFLKVLIVFLVVIIAVKGYSVLKGNNKNTEKTTTETVSEAKNSSTFTANMEKLKEAGAKYFDDNKDKLPKTEGNTTMVTLSDLVSGGYLTDLADEDGKNCNGESSYVTATLDGNVIKQKSNLVCGEASSYSMAYMDQNDSKENNSSSSNYSYSNTTSNTNSNGNSTKSTCTTGTCAPSVSVNTNVSQKVSVNGNSSKKSSSSYKPSTSNTNSSYSKYYTVRFDRNGGNVSYPSQTVKAYNAVAYPGNNSKNGCSFKGWYSNGSKYDFNTPVTSDMTLVANYSCSNYNYSYDDDYENEDELATDTYTTTVYTMGWDTKGTNYVNINHTLRLPSALNKSNVASVRIKKISYAGPINTSSRLNTYNSKHASTFMYNPNGWEATEDVYASNLSTINSGAVSFYYNNGYKSLSSARNNGFDVNWTADYVSKQCTRTFSVNGEDNKCDYGIYYKVTWEYEYYR